MVLQILFLGPSNLLEPNASFARMSQKLIVSPIVKTLVFSKVPEKVPYLCIICLNLCFGSKRVCFDLIITNDSGEGLDR